MPNLPNEKEIHQVLDTICTDCTFGQSARNVRLLRFLVDAALNHVDVNEYLVGNELFKQQYLPETNGNKLRAYFFNLRKNLNEFYTRSTVHHLVIFKIKHGQYNLQFVVPHETPHTRCLPIEEEVVASTTNWKPILWGVLIFVQLALTASTLVLYPNKSNRTCWSEYLSDKQESICIVGDANSCVSTEMLMITNALTHWFTIRKVKLSIATETGFEYSTTKYTNMLYIGGYDAMKGSKALFLQNSKRFCASDNGFMYSVNDTLVYDGAANNTINFDYVLVSYSELADGRQIMYFVSDNTTGLKLLTTNFINEEWLSTFYEQLPSRSAEFNALFRIENSLKTATDCELLHLEITTL